MRIMDKKSPESRKNKGSWNRALLAKVANIFAGMAGKSRNRAI